MKALLLVSIIIIASIGFIIFQNSPVFASCAVNEDWPDAPCFDVLPVNREEYRVAWAPYYDYKGSEWMEQKKIEMFDAKNSGKLAEWMDYGIQNHNVFSYYQSKGEISFPPEYDRPFFEDDFRYYLQFTQAWLFVIIGIVSGLAAIGVFVVIKKKMKTRFLLSFLAIIAVVLFFNLTSPSTFDFLLTCPDGYYAENLFCYPERIMVDTAASDWFGRIMMIRNPIVFR